MKMIYVGNGYFQSTEKLLDDSVPGSSYWSCYVPSPILSKIKIEPEKGKIYMLELKEMK